MSVSFATIRGTHKILHCSYKALSPAISTEILVTGWEPPGSDLLGQGRAIVAPVVRAWVGTWPTTLRRPVASSFVALVDWPSGKGFITFEALMVALMRDAQSEAGSLKGVCGHGMGP